MKKATKGKQRVALILTMVMVLSAMNISVTNKASRADTIDARAEAITGLGVGVIGTPIPPSDPEASWQGSYVYYGTYPSKPVRYRVLANDTTAYTGGTSGSAHTMLLDCDSILYHDIFDSNHYQIWEYSSIKKSINGNGFFNKAFTTVEGNAIPEATKAPGADVQYKYCYWGAVGLKGERIFFLSADEATNTAYGYIDNVYVSKLREKENIQGKDGKAWWWLRSPYSLDLGSVGFVSAGGYLNVTSAHDDEVGVSPAFNVNLSSSHL